MMNLGIRAAWIVGVTLLGWGCGGDPRRQLDGTYRIDSHSSSAEEEGSPLPRGTEWLRFSDDDLVDFFLESGQGFRTHQSSVFSLFGRQVLMNSTLYNLEREGDSLVLSRPGERVEATKTAGPTAATWAPVVAASQTHVAPTEGAGLTWDGAHLWIANHGELTSVDRDTGASAGGLTVTPNAYGIGWDGANLWVSSNGSSTIHKINMDTGGTLASSVAMGAWIYGIAWDGTHLWTTSGNEETVYQYDPVGNAVVSTVDVSEAPNRLEGMAYRNGHLFAVGGDSIFEIQPEPFQVVRSYRFPGVSLSGIATDGTDYFLFGYAGTESSEEYRLFRVTLPEFTPWQPPAG